MKWYSTKKFRMPSEHIICLVSDGSTVNINKKYLTIGYCDQENIWRDCNNDSKLVNVTHFCLIDPLPIEEND